MNEIMNQRIRLRMSELDTNATNVALASGLGKTAVRDILSGKTKSPTVETLGRLATTLQCTVSYLLGDVDHPQKFRPSDQEITDVRIEHVKELLRSNIFKKPSIVTESYGQNVLYGHPIAPEHSLYLFKMGDDSMAGVGILKGDTITAAIPYDETTFELYKHKFVVVVRYVIPPGLEEVSLREVVLGDELLLTTRPVSGDADTLIIDRQVPSKSTSTIFTTKDEQGLSIIGFVIRVTRDLPEI